MIKAISSFANYVRSPCNPLQRFFDQKSVRAAFDAEFYRILQPALSSYSNRDLYQHYVKQGWKDNIDPNAEFSVSDYLRRHKDVRETRTEPLLHYVTVGRHENRTVRLSRWGNFAAADVDPCRLNDALAKTDLSLIRQQLPYDIAGLSDRAVMSFVLVLGRQLNLRDSA